MPYVVASVLVLLVAGMGLAFKFRKQLGCCNIEYDDDGESELLDETEEGSENSI